MLSAAGIKPEELAQLARKAVDVLKRNLDAKKIEVVSFKGDFVEVPVPDLAVNQRAVEAALDFTGLSLSKQAEPVDCDITVNIVFPSACKPATALDITPLALPEKARRDE